MAATAASRDERLGGPARWGRGACLPRLRQLPDDHAVEPIVLLSQRLSVYSPTESGGGDGRPRRQMTHKPLFLVSIALGLLALAGCSEVKLALHVVKKLSLETQETEPLPPSQAEEEGYKLGQPYEIDHVWYFPSYDSNYDRTGTASWYGHPFHGRPTANGERYDMNDVTAAHPTLPLPSRVRVTNLENGRQLVVRVNDRGPFIDGRLIDLSRRAAQLLGFYRKGLAEVRVEYLGLDHIEPDDVPWPAESPKITACRQRQHPVPETGEPRSPIRRRCRCCRRSNRYARRSYARPGRRTTARRAAMAARADSWSKLRSLRGAPTLTSSGCHREHARHRRGRAGASRRPHGLCGSNWPGRFERRGGHHPCSAQSRRAHGVARYRSGIPLNAHRRLAPPPATV